MKLAISSINWTNDDLPKLSGHIPLEQSIKKMTLSRYAGCEVGNKFPRDHELLKNPYQKNLQICNQWFSFKFKSKSKEVIEKNR